MKANWKKTAAARQLKKVRSELVLEGRVNPSLVSQLFEKSGSLEQFDNLTQVCCVPKERGDEWLSTAPAGRNQADYFQHRFTEWLKTAEGTQRVALGKA